MAHMHEPIIGSEALAAGTLTRGALRWNYTAILPDVYIRRGAPIDILVKARAAWLWTGRRGVIAGATAAALYGVRPIDDNAPIELIASARRPQPGFVVRDERIDGDEVNARAWAPLTTPARTALDVARRMRLQEAVVCLDILSAKTDVSAEDVAPLEARYEAARGMGSAHRAIRLMDGGARSPDETRLRLSLIDAGLPRPRTSIPIRDRRWDDVIGMGWPDARVGVECGEHRRGLVCDVEFRDLLSRLGWRLIEVLPHYGLQRVVQDCREALWLCRRGG